MRLSDYWTRMTISFPMLEKFQTIISSNMFSGFFSSSPSGASIMQMWVLLMLPQRFLKLSSFLYILFSLLHSLTLISIILSSRLLMHSSASVILLLIHSRYFSLWLFISVHFCLFLLQIFNLIVKNFLYPLNLCLHSFPKILDHFYYHYDEFFLNRLPIISSFSCSYRFLS